MRIHTLQSDVELEISVTLLSLKALGSYFNDLTDGSRCICCLNDMGTGRETDNWVSLLAKKLASGFTLGDR